MNFINTILWSLFWRMPLWSLGYLWGRFYLIYTSASILFVEGRKDAWKGFVKMHHLEKQAKERPQND